MPHSGASINTFGSRQTYLALGIIAALLIAGGLVARFVYFAREQEELQAQETTLNLATSLVLNLEGRINTIDIALLACADEIGRRQATGTLDRDTMDHFLRVQQSRVSEDLVLRVADSKGLLAYGFAGESGAISIEDRDYFLAQRDRPTAGLSIGRPVLGRYSNRWIWAFARRINRADGSFGGIVYAPLFVDLLDKQFNQVQLPSGSSIALRSSQLELISRRVIDAPNPIPIGDKRMSERFLTALRVNPRQGTIVNDGKGADPVIKTFSYCSSEKYGFVVFVGIPREYSFREWRRLAWFSATLMATLCVIAALLQFLLGRAWARQDQAWLEINSSRDALLRVNQSLAGEVAERRLAQEKLRLARENAERYLRVVQTILVALDSAGRVTLLNPKGAAVLGYEEAELVGRDWFETCVAPAERTAAVTTHQRVMAGQTESYEFGQQSLLRKNGELLSISWHTSVLRDAEGRCIGTLSSGQDMTRQAAMEAQLRQAQKMEAVGQLAGGVAHDFNNILAAMIMQLDLLGDTPGLDATLVEGLAELKQNAGRAAELTRRLLAYGRRSVMEIKTVDLNEAVAEHLKMLRRLIDESIVLHHERADGALLVEADLRMLEQALLNLAVNARDAMPQGGSITLATSACLISPVEASENPDRRAGAFACLRVTDTGTGMDAATMQKIYEPFFTTKEVGKGSGLGLAMVHGIVAQHKGWLEVESAPGRGTSFRIYLPRAQGAAQSVPAAPPAAKLLKGSGTILVVEDEDIVRATLTRSLARLGYQVLEAASGQAAVEVWQGHREQIDVLLTDMIMPGGMTGVELAKRLREDKPALPVIVSSGYSSQLDRTGFDTIIYLPKPYQLAELGEALRRCLG